MRYDRDMGKTKVNKELRHALEKLSAKHRQFVEIYLADVERNAAGAYKAAGYNAKDAAVAASGGVAAQITESGPSPPQRF